jgi:hypothetical protein
MKLISKLILFIIIAGFLTLFLASAVKTGKPYNIALATSIVIAIFGYLMLKPLHISPLRYPKAFIGVLLLPFIIIYPLLLVILVIIFIFSKPGRTVINSLRLIMGLIIIRLMSDDNDE